MMPLGDRQVVLSSRKATTYDFIQLLSESPWHSSDLLGSVDPVPRDAAWPYIELEQFHYSRATTTAQRFPPPTAVFDISDPLRP